ncbi:MAG: ankyrin repeat domain-containing protein [Candidatus Kapaibacterium sp.]
MTKKAIQFYFKAISNGDLGTVSELLDKTPEFITVCNTAPPKKHDGQSGLQLAFKTGNFEVANLLIIKGSDVNFMEISEINEWTAPVLHDCIRAVIFNSYTLQKDTKIFDNAFSLLELMLTRKADPTSIDSYGNTCLHRAILDANQMLVNPSSDFTDNILITQLRSVFNELFKAGADKKQSSERRESAEKLYQSFKLDKYQLW